MSVFFVGWFFKSVHSWSVSLTKGTKQSLHVPHSWLVFHPAGSRAAWRVIRQRPRLATVTVKLHGIAFRPGTASFSSSSSSLRSSLSLGPGCLFELCVCILGRPQPCWIPFTNSTAPQKVIATLAFTLFSWLSYKGMLLLPSAAHKTG
jgi:hypothetical protein